LMIEASGGNAFRPALTKTGLQLRHLRVALADEDGTSTLFALQLSLTAV
jgi:hypothetical protein